jgi:hypothetical protein
MQITRRLTSPRPLVTDPEVPGAALVLCVDALTAWLSETLGQPCTVTLRRVRHEHGVSVALAFDLTTVSEGRRLTRPCVARAYAQRSRAAFKALLATLPADECLALDPTRRIVVTGAAGDRTLPLLPRLFGLEGGERVLGRALPRHSCTGAAAVRTVRHDPGRRWVGVLDHGDGAPLGLRAYRSSRHLDRATMAYDAFRGTAVQVPAILGTSRSLAFAAVSSVDGQRLDGSSRTDDWQAAGVALAKLHACPASGLTSTSSDAETATLDVAAGRIAALLPDSATQAHQLADLLARLLERIPRDKVPLHGAFAPDRVVLGTDGTVTLVDLDWARFGPSAADVGGLVAATLVAAEDAGMAPRAHREIAALLDGYRTVRRTPDPFAVGLHAAASRFRTALDPFLAGASDWRAQTGRRLDAARASLDDMALVGSAR